MNVYMHKRIEINKMNKNKINTDKSIDARGA